MNQDTQRQLQSVGVVIVNFNAGPHLLKAVEAVRAELVDEIIVVDNGSTDDSVNTLLEFDNTIEVIRLPNPGFGAANNEGARRLATDIVFCLNPDSVVHVGAVEKLKRALNEHPEAAAVGPKILEPSGSLYPSARAFPQLSNSVGHALFGVLWPNNVWTRRYKRLGEDYDSSHEVDWVSGAAFFARRAAFDSVDGFDDSYFMYFEDVDLCWRLSYNGWTIRYAPEAVVTHVGGVSTATKPYKMLKEHHRSAIRYNLRTAKGLEKLLLPVLVSGLLARLPLAWLHRLWVNRADRHDGTAPAP